MIVSALETVSKAEEKILPDVTVNAECGLDDNELRFIKAIKESDNDEIKRIANKLGMMPDSFAECVNERVSEAFGDVIIDGFYPDMCLIEDYEEDIEKWLLKIMK